MPTLQKLGLVEKVITAPVMFKAIPTEDALSILIKRKTKEYMELQVMVKELLKDFKENKTKMTLQEKEYQFILIPKKEAVILRRRKAIENIEVKE